MALFSKSVACNENFTAANFKSSIASKLSEFLITFVSEQKGIKKVTVSQ